MDRCFPRGLGETVSLKLQGGKPKIFVFNVVAQLKPFNSRCMCYSSLKMTVICPMSSEIKGP